MADIATLGIRVDSTGVVKASNDLGKLAQQGAKAETQTNKAASSLGGMGRSAGQAGIQIQQFVGQVQGGVSPMVALSQQATDLGFVLGFPLLGAVTGIAAALAGPLISALIGGQEELSGFSEKAKQAEEDLIGFMESLRSMSVIEYQRTLNEAADAILAAQEKLSEAREDAGSIYRDKGDLEALAQAEADLINAQTLYNQIRDRFESLEVFTAKGSDDDKKSVDRFIRRTQKQADALDRFIQRTQEQAETLGMTNTQLLVYRARQLGATQADIERIQALGMEIDAYDERLEKEKEIAQWKKDNERDLKRANEERLKAQEEAFKATVRQLKPIEDGFVNLINGTKGVSGAFKDMARSVIDDLIRMHIQSTITNPLAGLIQGAGGFSGMFSSFFGGGGGATSFAAPGYMPPSFAGGGYTGMAPRTGGIDGQGGFPAILHPNETVVDHSKGGSGMSQPVVVNQTINVTTGVAQTVRTEIANLMPQIVNASKQGVLEARKRGGSFASTFGAS